GADVLVVEALGLLVGQLHHLAGTVGEAFIHAVDSDGSTRPSPVRCWACCECLARSVPRVRSLLYAKPPPDARSLARLGSAHGSPRGRPSPVGIVPGRPNGGGLGRRRPVPWRPTEPGPAPHPLPSRPVPTRSVPFRDGPKPRRRGWGGVRRPGR